jgi:hypothetical protein
MENEKKCAEDGCSSNKIYGRGLCTVHYQKHRNAGTINNFKTKKELFVRGKCSVDGCNGDVKAKGYCSKHYRRFLKWGNPMHVERQTYKDSQRYCRVDGCDRTILARGLCSKHYSRFKSHGDTEIVKVTHFKGSLKDRIIFWSKKDDKTGCWNWQGARNSDGYGNTTIDNKSVGAHRAAYMAFKGEIPKGMSICHKCDNPACCNPDHLFLGTHTDNIRDMHVKGRANICHGEKCGQSKISRKDAVSIYVSQFLGIPTKELSKKYGIVRDYVRYIQRKKSWKRELDDIDVLYRL